MASTLGRCGARVTNRVGRRRVTGQKKRLAAATAEVSRAAIAALAGFGHPFFAAEFLERFRFLPNLTQAAVFQIVEMQARNDLGRMAWKRVAVWRDEHQLLPPSPHARLRILRVIIGHNEFDVDFAAQAFFGALQKFDGAIQLLARGKKILAVGKSPAVILHVGKFDPAGAGRFGERQHFRKLIDVAAVNDEIQRQGHAAPLEPFEDAEFLGVRFRAGEFIGGFFGSALKTQLNMIEARLDDLVEPRFVEGNPGGDEVDVQSGLAGGADEFHNIGAGQRLAAGKINLQNSRFGGFAEHARPNLGGKFVRSRFQFKGIRAVDTMQRAPVS